MCFGEKKVVFSENYTRCGGVDWVYVCVLIVQFNIVKCLYLCRKLITMETYKKIFHCQLIELKESGITKQELVEKLTAQLEDYTPECVFETVSINGLVKAEDTDLNVRQ